MRFGVLGPLAVWTRNGEPVTVPGVKVRALLADLLVHQGWPVSADRLVEDLWGNRPPGNPIGALQAKVSQLRRVLEEAETGGRDLVLSSSPGYLLRTDPDAVDASWFATLTGRARATNDPRAKAALLGDALALWRGAAFADFGDEPFTQAAVTRLEEDRLAALDEQAEARLALGEHNLLVGELGELVLRYPLRERLRAAQLRALYRAGRQDEALASYRELRNRLTEELGLDPSAELVALHDAILRQDPELDAQVPAIQVARPGTNLPASRTRLIGRASAVSEVRSLLGAGRLATLTGPGGVGKTRLAVETARELLDTFPDGVWLVEVAALGRLDTADGLSALAEAVMTVLGTREDASAVLLGAGDRQTAADRLVEVLRAKQLLLVFDNCERVVESAAELAERLLRVAPGVRLLTTSQEPLGLAGEALWPVPPLALPDAADAEPATLERSSAVELFVTRVAAVVPGFTLNSENAQAIAVICQRLDGIPLALELAATRVRALGVHGLIARLDDRFRLLATGYRGAPPRQRTLRAMIDWSWELLSEDERIVLRRLAVHADGCALEAAEQVCASEDIPGEQVLPLLARLVDRSLVATTDGMDGPRYQLLESVAEYCRGRLREAGEAERVRQRHHHYYLELAERAEPRLYGHEQRRWLELLDREAANLRSTLGGVVADRRPELALRLMCALTWYLLLRGRLREARRSLDRALAIDGDAPVALRAAATAWQSGIALLEGGGTDQTAPSPVAALRLFADTDDRTGRARAAWFLGFALFNTGNLADGEEFVHDSLTDFRLFGDRWGEAAALSSRAYLGQARGDLAAATRDGERSMAFFRELGDRWGQLQASFALGSLAEVGGDYERAAGLHWDGLRMAEELGLWLEASDRLSGLGRIALLAENYAQARTFHEQARRLAAEQGYKVGELYAQIGIGLGARREGNLDDAEKHLRGVLEWNRRLDFEPSVVNALLLAELGFVAEQRGDARAAQALHRDGLAVTRKLGDPRALALALEGLAGVQALAGHHDHAAQMLGTAAAARQSAGAPLPPAERGDVDRITAKVRKELGPEAFATEFEHGATLDADYHAGCLDTMSGLISTDS